MWTLTSHSHPAFLFSSFCCLSNFMQKPDTLFIHKTTEMEPKNLENLSTFKSGCSWIKGLPLKLVAKIGEVAGQTKRIVKDDPRKLVHSLKVGLALTSVSLFYYFQPLYNSFGVSAMWAVMTVVVVFEFYVGATLGKGMNRGLATLLAGGLGLGAHHLASATGKTCEPILIGLFVFLQAVVSTFVRFLPKVKARYDYGMMIFILTFCLVSISGLRTDEILEMAHKRLSTILIGGSTCVIVSILVCPAWAGEDLHALVAQNIEKLGNFMEGFANECFREAGESAKERSSTVSVLDSKSREETLANFARWEPGHGKFMYRHPWKQYLKIGNLTRQCACRVEALNGYSNSKIQAPEEVRRTIQEAFFSMSSECAEVLKELGSTVKTMNKPSSPKTITTNLKVASKNLKALLKSDLWDEYSDLSQIISVAAVASLLIDIVISVENINEAVNELSSLANFTSKDSIIDEKSGRENKKKVSKVAVDDIQLVTITIEGSSGPPFKQEDQFKFNQTSNQAGNLKSKELENSIT